MTRHLNDLEKKTIELEIRRKLFFLISRNPGIHFRDLQRRSQTATGALTYHLDLLVKRGLLTTVHDGEYLRYYSSGELTEKERSVIELLRHVSIRHILLFLLQNEKLNNEQLSIILNLSPSTVSWHIKKLLQSNLLNTEVEGKKVIYSISEPEFVKTVLIKYKESFIDKLVNRFTDMWE